MSLRLTCDAPGCGKTASCALLRPDCLIVTPPTWWWAERMSDGSVLIACCERHLDAAMSADLRPGQCLLDEYGHEVTP